VFCPNFLSRQSFDFECFERNRILVYFPNYGEALTSHVLDCRSVVKIPREEVVYVLKLDILLPPKALVKPL